jgi:hypothetical protein
MADSSASKTRPDAARPARVILLYPIGGTLA